ncbi:S16 family serine protease [Streptomyces sp. NPDC001941]|uniref:S16 family serine protease n=1 Tax=Streptomyces sp. NPDC001941 TaxID=3154659 RepID=UPI0033215908
MIGNLSRSRALALCAVPVVALFATAAFAPLPFVIAQPGATHDVLGADRGKPVIEISGAPVRATEGQLRMTTILATGPSAENRITDVADAWFRSDREVLPRQSVYPQGQSDQQVEKHNLDQMTQAQDSAVTAALGYLKRDPAKVKVRLTLADVGGPSAGLLFSLGVVDKLDGDGAGGDLTGGRVIAGTGTITPDGKVGPVGGVGLKPQAAGRDGAKVFLVPAGQCAEAGAEVPAGMKLVPVGTLQEAVKVLKALKSGGSVPSC